MAASVDLVDGNNGYIQQVVTGLCQIKELVMQQEQVHLDRSAPDRCKHLASQIFSIADCSIRALITNCGMAGPRKRPAAPPSPLRDASDTHLFEATMKRNKKSICSNKKSHELTVSSADYLAGDGHDWLKNGRKEILGTKHKRQYYRCKYQKSQNCKAMKQVQPTDEDPTLFHIAYKDEHTCVVPDQTVAVTPGQAATDAQALGYKYDANPDASSLQQNLSSTVMMVEPEQQLQWL